MFDDLIDPDPPSPDIRTLADVSERARRLRLHRQTIRVVGLTLTVAALITGGIVLLGAREAGDLPADVPFATGVPDDVVVDLDDLVSAPDTTVPVEPPPSTPATAPTPTVSDPLPAAVPEPIPFLAVGDTVMLGAAPALSERGVVVDAQVSRQMSDMVPVLEQMRDQHLLGTVVVVHLGTNGPFTQDTLDAFLATMDEVPNVILITVRADRPWTAGNNALLRAADGVRDNRILIDWEALAANCPGDCFYDDGIHLREDGQRYYADLISDVLGI